MIRFDFGTTRNKKSRYLLTPDADGWIADKLERTMRIDELIACAPNPMPGSTRNGTRYQNQYAVGLPTWNWPAAPAAEINTVYWPVTGATRWAFGVFLVRGSDVVTPDKPPPGPKPDPAFGLTTGLLVLDSGHGDEIKLPMTALPAHFISANVALQPFVCARYFWQFQHPMTYPLPSDGSKDWGGLLDALEARLGAVTLTRSDIDAKYLVPDWNEFGRTADNPAVLLDAVAASLQMRLTCYPRRTANTIPTSPAIECKLESATDARATLDAFAKSPDRNKLVKLHGGLATAEHVPAECQVYFHRFRDCHPVYNAAAVQLVKTATPAAAAGGVTSQTNVRRIVSSCFADYSDQSSGVAGTARNDAELEQLANRITTDIGLWLDPKYAPFDFTYAGLAAKWPVTGFDDAIVYRLGQDDPANNYPSSTRIQSLPSNVLPETQLSQDPSLTILDVTFLLGQAAEDFDNDAVDAGDEPHLVGLYLEGSGAAYLPQIYAKRQQHGTNYQKLPIYSGQRVRLDWDIDHWIAASDCRGFRSGKIGSISIGGTDTDLQPACTVDSNSTLPISASGYTLVINNDGYYAIFLDFDFDGENDTRTHADTGDGGVNTVLDTLVGYFPVPVVVQGIIYLNGAQLDARQQTAWFIPSDGSYSASLALHWFGKLQAGDVLGAYAKLFQGTSASSLTGRFSALYLGPDAP
jgi:hypothetical protein